MNAINRDLSLVIKDGNEKLVAISILGIAFIAVLSILPFISYTTEMSITLTGAGVSLFLAWVWRKYKTISVGFIVVGIILIAIFALKLNMYFLVSDAAYKNLQNQLTL